VGATGLHVLARSGGEPITVTVLGIKGNQVRISIDAPTDITILREELVGHRPIAEGNPYAESA